VIFAYTVKGYRLPTQGHPRNHSAVLSTEQFRELAGRLGTDPDRPGGRFAVDSEAGQLCVAAASRLRRPGYLLHPLSAIPMDIGRTHVYAGALGRVLLDLTREAPEAARRVVTVSPDVSSSTR
jgi:pyruvate dehydrogenase E1 component